MKVIGYPTPGKEKARIILDAFCTGARGEVVSEIPRQLLPGAAAFYGVTPATKHLWDQARREGRTWFYLDNAYLDPCRGKYFRVTRNRLQVRGVGKSDGRRFVGLGIDVKPWRAPGSHVLVCPQSDEFLSICAGYRGRWAVDAMNELRRHTGRELRLRPWQRDKKAWFATLPQDLEHCWALVCHSSSSALSALIAGVPAFSTSQDAISWHLTGRALSEIESPARPDGRVQLLQVCADNQWTLDEMRSGLCWEMLQAQERMAA